MKKNNIVYVLKIALPLLLICAVTVAVLAAINALTAPVIAANEQEKLDNNMTAFYGEGIEASIYENDSFDASVKKAYQIKKDGQLIGCCFDVTGSGAYKGKIEVLVALDDKGVIVGISNVKNGETPSIGGRVLADGSVKDQYVGATADNLPPFSEVSISGATRTSTALQNAVNNALAAYKIMAKGGAKA